MNKSVTYQLNAGYFMSGIQLNNKKKINLGNEYSPTERYLFQPQVRIAITQG